MGAIEKITCTSCRSKWQCRTGCGMMHGQLENVKDFFPQEIKDKLESYGAETKFPYFNFEFRLSCCEHCKTVESVPVIQLPDRQEEYTGVCEECGQKSKLIENLKKTRCPVCGEYSLIREETGMWD